MSQRKEEEEEEKKEEDEQKKNNNKEEEEIRAPGEMRERHTRHLLENQNKQQDQMIGLNFSWRLTSK
jgi:hypothetical protein